MISYIAAKTVENIYVESGKRLTISCAYTGVYIEINKEVTGTDGKRKNQGTGLFYLKKREIV